MSFIYGIQFAEELQPRVKDEFENLAAALQQAFSQTLTGTEGAWTAIPHNSGDYFGMTSMTWTVDAGDMQSPYDAGVSACAYRLDGKTMFLTYSLRTTSVGGTPSAVLFIRLPAGKTAARWQAGVIYGLDNGTQFNGLWTTRFTGFNDRLAIVRNDGANFTASTNATTIYLQATLEVL